MIVVLRAVVGETLLFFTEGVNTRAVITDCQIVHGRGQSTRLTYSYMAQGQQHTDFLDLKPEACANYLGLTVEIQYLASNPQRSQVIDKHVGLGPEKSLLAIGIISLLTLGLFYKNISDALKALKTIKTLFIMPWRFRESTLLDGELTDISKQSYGKVHNIYVKYQFLTPAGITIQGEQKKSRSDLRGHPLPPPGTSVKVLYVDDDNYLML